MRTAKQKPLDFRKIFKVAARSKIKPELCHLFVKKGFVYATDAFKAVKLKTTFEPDQEGYISKISAMVGSEKSKEVGIEVLPELEVLHLQYPDVDKVIPATGYIKEITVNRKYLIDLLEAMQTGDMTESVTLKIPEAAGRPILFENANGTGILMPFNK